MKSKIKRWMKCIVIILFVAFILFLIVDWINCRMTIVEYGLYYEPDNNGCIVTDRSWVTFLYDMIFN